MSSVLVKVRVDQDHRISGLAPDEVPEGEHEVYLATPPKKQTWTSADLPKHDLPWDGSISLRREDMYGDDGRDAVFVGTNVLVYAARAAAPEHELANVAIDRLRDEGRLLWISRQVIREYLAVVTRPQPGHAAQPMEVAVNDVQRLRELFFIAEERSDTLDRLLDLLASRPTAGRQVHDAHLVATMLSNGIGALLTFNTRDFRRFKNVIRLEAP